MRNVRLLLALLICAAVLIGPTGVRSAQALDVFEEDGTRVGAILFLRGGLELNAEAGELQDPALRVNFARLGLNVSRDGIGDAMMLMEGNSGNVDLLDLLMRLTPNERFELGMGRYRPHFGLEWYYPRFSIPFRSRSASSALALDRMIGTHVAVIASGDNVIRGSRLDVALYSPDFGARSSSASAAETFLAVRMQLRLAQRVILHAAVAERAYGARDNELTTDQTRLSVGAQYQHGSVVALVEFVSLSQEVALNASELNDARALSFFGAYRVPVGQRELMPVLGFDLSNDPLRGDYITNARTRLGLQYSLLGDEVATGVTWDWTNPGATTELVAFNYYLQFLL